MIAFRPSPARLPPDRRVYAIGDVHGCLDRLRMLHAAIAEDCARRPVAAPLLIHLGDYVDRGPDSAGVVALLAAGDPLPGIRTVNLMGNHEHTMLAALSGDGAAAIDWMFNGGVAALASWGIAATAPRGSWVRAVPPAHRAFLENLALRHAEGGYLFVHAGVRPGVPLERQASEDLRGIRQPFLSTERSFGAVIVHGHTPTQAPVVKANRIGIDTGAVFGGKLTCVVLEADRLAFLQA
ncbi:MAG: serine/threonine protein phosphatase [Acidisphaera sp.]|nr:serine/threonine protein phosphatase [Acidisphaera sp.]